ncbi:MAG: hypothetical protein WDZ94_05495 [Patescibacteria group bacterium]
MLTVKLGKAFEYLPQANIDLDEAFDQLFGDLHPAQLDIPEETLRSLANEWLLFDFRHTPGTSLIEQYYFSDPDNLSQVELDELRQIIESQSLYLFQTYKSSKSPYVYVESIFTGKKYTVYDRALADSVDTVDGSFVARLAKVGRTYYFVGSDPLVFAIRYTSRAIKIFVQEKTPAPTLKDMLLQFSQSKEKLHKNVDVAAEQKKVQKKYQKLAQKFQSKVSFQQITDFVYEENYQDHFADYFTDLLELGIPEELVVDHSGLFLEIWNFYPHKELGDQCPHDVYQEKYVKGAMQPKKSKQKKQKIQLSQAQFFTLMKAVYLGNWMANAQRVEDRFTDYEEIEDVIFSLAAEFDLGTYVSHEPEDGDTYYPTSEFEDETDVDKIIEEYDEETFWTELAERLGERDFLEKYSAEEIKAMSREERFEKRYELVDQVSEELNKYGLERVRIVKLRGGTQRK